MRGEAAVVTQSLLRALQHVFYQGCSKAPLDWCVQWVGRRSAIIAAFWPRLRHCAGGWFFFRSVKRFDVKLSLLRNFFFWRTRMLMRTKTNDQSIPRCGIRSQSQHANPFFERCCK